VILALAVLSLSLPASQDEKPDEARFNRLIDQLGADFLEDRESALKSLEKAGPAATPFLIAALGRPDFRIRKACVDLLTALRAEAAVDRVGEVFRGDEDAGVRDAAFQYLRAIGKPAESHLIVALRSEKADHRREAAKTLTDMRSPKCHEQMNAMFESDPDKASRDQAFEYLKTIGKPAEPHLLKILGNADPAVRKGAMAGLRKVQEDEKTQSDEALKAVGRLFAGEADAPTLKDAFDYLRASGPAAESFFVEGLRSRHDPVRNHSIDGLRSLKSEKAIDAVARAFVEDSSDEVRRQACEFLKSHGLKAEEALIRALSGGDARVKLMAIPALGEIKSRKPLDAIAAMFREDRDPEIHRAAFDYLKGLGSPAEKELVRALEDSDKRIRLEAIRTLGFMKSQAAIDPLIEFMVQLDPEAKKAAEDALVHIGRPAVEAVFKAVEGGRVKRRSADAILSLYYQEEVEKLLDALITPEGGSGFFGGMFKPLESLGKEKAVPVLLKIAADPGYPWRLRASGAAERPPDWSRQMRELAVMALGDLGDASVAAPLREALKKEPVESWDGVAEELVIALHRLGDEKPFEEFQARISARAEETLKARNFRDGCAALFQLGLVRNRLGRSKEAEEAYRRILQVVGEQKPPEGEVDILPTVYYNLACLNSLRGERSPALEWLRKAVEAGFRDRDWIRMDRDLDSLRGDERYTRLLADDKLFQKGPND